MVVYIERLHWAEISAYNDIVVQLVFSMLAQHCASNGSHYYFIVIMGNNATRERESQTFVQWLINVNAKD